MNTPSLRKLKNGFSQPETIKRAIARRKELIRNLEAQIKTLEVRLMTKK